MTNHQTQDFLVLTAAPGSGLFSPDWLADLQEAMPGLPDPRHLSDDALEFTLNDEMTGIVDALSNRYVGAPFDINRVAGQDRKKRMLIADLESTIIEQECLDELAKQIGKEDVIADITERAMRGELDFEPALKERVAMLKGLPEAALQAALRHRHIAYAGCRHLAGHPAGQWGFLWACVRWLCIFCLPHCGKVGIQSLSMQ